MSDKPKPMTEEEYVAFKVGNLHVLNHCRWIGAPYQVCSMCANKLVAILGASLNEARAERDLATKMYTDKFDEWNIVRTERDSLRKQLEKSNKDYANLQADMRGQQENLSAYRKQLEAADKLADDIAFALGKVSVVLSGSQDPRAHNAAKIVAEAEAAYRNAVLNGWKK